MELSISPDYNIIEIVFQDKTSLTFNLEPVSKSSLNLSVGNLGNTNRSNAGDLFPAFSNFPNIKPERAERRALLLELGTAHTRLCKNGIVSESVTFRSYCKRLWDDYLHKAKPWARDQIGWPLVVITFIPLISAVAVHRTVDWQLFWTSVLFYFVALSIYATSHFIRAGWQAYSQKDHDFVLLTGALAARTQKCTQAEVALGTERDEKILQMERREDLEEKLDRAQDELLAANGVIATKENEISLLKQIPANIGVEILELQRRAIDSQQEGVKSWKYDIFVRAKLELKNLGSIAISQMRVELSLQWALEIPQEKRDIESWRLFISRKIDGEAGYAYHRIKPVKEELTQGVPEEGWLHYVTNRTIDEELDGSSLKLIVETSRGASHAELDAHTNKWSPWGSGRIVPDPDTTNIGLPNIGE